jgi:hypothetical protein
VALAQIFNQPSYTTLIHSSSISQIRMMVVYLSDNKTIWIMA